jgi:hypothetical protein
VELLKAPPAGEEAFLLDLIANRVPPGVDEAAYVKAGFLSAIVTGNASSPLIDPAAAVKLLGNMHGGYNVATLVNLLDDDALAESAAEELKGTILVFDAFHDVAGKSRCGQRPRQGCDAILGPMLSGFPQTTRCQKASSASCSRLPAKPIRMICHRPKTHGRAQTYPCTPAPCTKCSVMV